MVVHRDYCLITGSQFDILKLFLILECLIIGIPYVNLNGVPKN